MAAHELGSSDCRYALLMKSENVVEMSEGGVVSILDDGGKKSANLLFSIACKKNEIANFCESQWVTQYIEVDVHQKNAVNQRIYEKFFDRENSVVFSANVGATSKPRPRLLGFCVDLEGRHIEGWVSVGDEAKNREGDALRILKTLTPR